MSDFPECVLVFGSTGFLGRNVMAALDGKCEVHGFSSRALDYIDMMPRFPHRTAIVHVAAHRYLASTFGDDQPTIVRRNIDITNVIYEFAIERGIAEVRQASSSAVYSTRCDLMDDDQPLDYSSPMYAPYCTSKRYAEMAANLWRGANINTISFRITSAYGKFDSTDEQNAHVTPAFIMRALRNDPEFVIKGNPEMTRDFIYAGDVANAFVESLKLRGVHDAVNLATGRQTRIRDMAVACMKAATTWRPIRVEPAMYHAAPRPRATTEKLHRLLPDLPPFRSLDEGLAETVAWYREQMREAA